MKSVETDGIFKALTKCFLFFQELQSKSKVCANVFCGAGRECAVNEKGEPSCLCIEVSVRCMCVCVPVLEFYVPPGLLYGNLNTISL